MKSEKISGCLKMYKQRFIYLEISNSHKLSPNLSRTSFHKHMQEIEVSSHLRSDPWHSYFSKVWHIHGTASTTCIAVTAAKSPKENLNDPVISTPAPVKMNSTILNKVFFLEYIRTIRTLRWSSKRNP